MYLIILVVFMGMWFNGVRGRKVVGAVGPFGWIIGNEGDFLSGSPWVGVQVMVHCHAHSVGVMVGNRVNIMIGMVRFRVH